MELGFVESGSRERKRYTCDPVVGSLCSRASGSSIRGGEVESREDGGDHLRPVLGTGDEEGGSQAEDRLASCNSVAWC